VSALSISLTVMEIFVIVRLPGVKAWNKKKLKRTTVFCCHWFLAPSPPPVGNKEKPLYLSHHGDERLKKRRGGRNPDIELLNGMLSRGFWA